MATMVTMITMQTATVGMAIIEMATVEITVFQGTTTETTNPTVSRMDVHAETTTPAALTKI